MPKIAKSKKVSEKVSHEQLGRMLQNIYESGYIDRNTAYKMSFFKGVLGGLGGVIGATIVLAILLWILSLLHYVPFVNRITDNVQCTIEQRDKRPAPEMSRCDIDQN